MTAKKKTVRVQVIHSPHDGGYYCEVYDPKTGVELWCTQVYPTEQEAKQGAVDAGAYRVSPECKRED